MAVARGPSGARQRQLLAAILPTLPERQDEPGPPARFAVGHSPPPARPRFRTPRSALGRRCDVSRCGRRDLDSDVRESGPNARGQPDAALGRIERDVRSIEGAMSGDRHFRTSLRRARSALSGSHFSVELERPALARSRRRGGGRGRVRRASGQGIRSRVARAGAARRERAGAVPLAPAHGASHRALLVHAASVARLRTTRSASTRGLPGLARARQLGRVPSFFQLLGSVTRADPAVVRDVGQQPASARGRRARLTAARCRTAHPRSFGQSSALALYRPHRARPRGLWLRGERAHSRTGDPEHRARRAPGHRR